MSDSLEGLRKKIDDCDEKIVRLINDRAQFASRIGSLKQSTNSPVYVPHREAAVYDKVSKNNEGPLPDSALQSIYREIMGATIALQRPTRVSYFGDPGSFTNMAALSKFGSGIEYISMMDVAGVFRAVANDNADFGVIPVENSSEGSVNISVDLLAETHLKVSGELYLPIHHNLLSIASRESIQVIFSHPQPFGQCRNWLAAHFPNADLRPSRSTSAAAKLTIDTPNSAAIASGLSAELYNIPILFSNIEDVQNNITRFFIIGKEPAGKTGNDKTSIVFSTGDEPGALMSMLQPFDDHGLNLTKIESRPSRRKAWEYIFIVDCIGHYSDENIQKVIEQLKPHCRFLEVIGSYPIAKKLAVPTARNPSLRKPDNGESSISKA